jgi:cation/acetate symporter
MLTGLLSAVILVCASPSVWSVKPGAAILVGAPWFPLSNPGIISIPLGFLGAIFGTLLSKKNADDSKYQEIQVRGNTGI